jgi:hypothetical protein
MVASGLIRNIQGNKMDIDDFIYEETQKLAKFREWYKCNQIGDFCDDYPFIQQEQNWVEEYNVYIGEINNV